MLSGVDGPSWKTAAKARYNGTQKRIGMISRPTRARTNRSGVIAIARGITRAPDAITNRGTAQKLDS